MKAYFFSFLFCCTFFLPLSGKAQKVSVSGYVKNQFTGELKKNAGVVELVSGVGTITNSEGYYRLLLNPGQQKLEISSQGFMAYSFTLNLVSDTIISVGLIPQDMRSFKLPREQAPPVEPFIASDSGKTAVPVKK